MNIARKILHNSIWLFVAHVGGRLFNVMVTMALTRYLGIQEFGRYSLVYAFCAIFAFMTDIGIDTIVVREASRDMDKAGKMMGNGIILKAAFALLAIVAATASARVLGYPAESVGLILLASFSFLASPLTLYGSMFQAVLRLRYPALFDIAGRLLSLIFVLFALALRGSLPAIVTALLAATFVQAALTWLLSRRSFRPSFRIDTGLCKRLISESWPLAVNNLMIALILRMDQIMIERMCHDGDFQLGIYSAAVKFCELFNFIPTIYFASVFPLLSRLQTGEEEAFRKLYTLSMKYMILAIVPVALYCTLNAGGIMSLLFGDAFRNAAAPMAILIWSEVFVFTTWVVFNTAVSLGAQRIMPPFTLVALAVNFGLNLWVIPRYGAAGAAASSLVSYSFILLLASAARRLRPLALAFLRSAIRPAAGAFFLWVILAHLRLDLFLSGLVFFPAFLALMILFGALGRGDWEIVRRALSHGAGEGRP